MIRAHIIEYAPVLFIVMVGLFAFLKLVFINVYGLREDPLGLYLDSFRIYSSQVIKNTFYNKLKKYYKTSNSINSAFYSVFVLLWMVYFLFKVL
jgi:hypothetical protein